MDGRNASCPVALPAVSTPTTRPRRRTNHWSATVAANTSAIEPVPSPIMRPQVSTSIQGTVATMLRAAPAATRSAQVVTARIPNRGHEGRRERRHQAVEEQVDRDGGGELGARPAELGFERQHEHARRGPEPAAPTSARNATAATIQAGCSRRVPASRLLTVRS
jgi:hypothetical protein